VDPDETIVRIDAVRNRMAAKGDYADPDDDRELADLYAGLDDWVRGGGFLPRAWRTQAPTR
jgi:hypothetical protein